MAILVQTTSNLLVRSGMQGHVPGQARVTRLEAVDGLVNARIKYLHQGNVLALSRQYERAPVWEAVPAFHIKP